jgi:paraquat-inducible protein B
LTGSRLITLDLVEDAEPATMQQAGKYQTIPTIAAGLENIERKISEILNKINQMPLKQVMNNTNVMIKKLTGTIETADKTMLDLHTMLGSKDAQQLPNSINTTLKELKIVLEGLAPGSEMYQELNNSMDQLNSTLRNIESITHSVDTKPSSLIFSKPKRPDLQPEAPKK